MSVAQGGLLPLDPIWGLCYLEKDFRAEVAQSVEHGTENPGVPSSTLGLGTRFLFILPKFSLPLYSAYRVYSSH
jgi:hypothetical protein